MALSTHALTTLATALDELALTSDSGGAQDLRLTRYIEEASAEIEAYCDVHFEYGAAISESVAGYGTPYIQVARVPIITITSITYAGTTLDSTVYEVSNADAGIIYNPSGWQHTGAVLPGSISGTPMLDTERKWFTVVYAGGYVTPNQAGTRTLPYDLEAACLELVVQKWRQRGVDRSVKSESVLGARVEYERGGLPTSITQKIYQYKRMSIAV